MMLDRNIQREILHTLYETYPEPNFHAFYSVTKDSSKVMGTSIKYCYPHCSSEQLKINLFYLQEHNLVENAVRPSASGYYVDMNNARLTHKGVDFLLDDGGLSAILGTVIVKLHEDTIKQLLIAKIEKSALPEQEKSSLLSGIKNLSGKALEQVVTNLVDLGFDHSEKAISLLQKTFESLL
ncbi:hypothetical protein [Rodentibacter pneumotropicus]|uniref:Uncharacterized protein n=1 Tax=Rodentibacter pneumotropicus TaxID=758 RepID=A0A1V3K929_9PAST|nr:hypothetical protein [Rodentibacter pneumotropicus]MCQ9120940.1 hypothetical protein [Rodentibacter pneumotropicus]OOF69111.1 hypothetical protein BKG95_02275 [Rodentibacter pneumotropicus]THA14891.1 hypothetical protein D3M76_06575 [Rodentibacter pneumotropicus]